VVFISLLPRHAGSIDRQAAGSRKLFLCGSGIANILGKPSEGQLFEQSIFQNLRMNHKLAFYNKDGGREIVFIADKKVGLEVKMAASQADIKNLRLGAEPIQLAENYVVTSQYSDKKEVIVATDI